MAVGLNETLLSIHVGPNETLLSMDVRLLNETLLSMDVGLNETLLSIHVGRFGDDDYADHDDDDDDDVFCVAFSSVQLTLRSVRNGQAANPTG